MYPRALGEAPEGSDIAYWSAGDHLTIIQCGKKGENRWEISKPTCGLVWEREVNR